jgi:cyclic pyranopterin monophosphate synthase
MKAKKRKKRRPAHLTHADGAGQARMVDVSAKPDTERIARARGSIRMNLETLDQIRRNELHKGDVLSVAKLAGIMAAKKTADLIPLCHPVQMSEIKVALTPDETLPGLLCEVTVKATGKTGVEMEAITAVAITLVTVYDMAKAADKGMQINDICLLEKAGGSSGHWRRGSHPA